MQGIWYRILFLTARCQCNISRISCRPHWRRRNARSSCYSRIKRRDWLWKHRTNASCYPRDQCSLCWLTRWVEAARSFHSDVWYQTRQALRVNTDRYLALNLLFCNNARHVHRKYRLRNYGSDTTGRYASTWMAKSEAGTWRGRIRKCSFGSRLTTHENVWRWGQCQIEIRVVPVRGELRGDSTCPHTYFQPSACYEMRCWSRHHNMLSSAQGSTTSWTDTNSSAMLSTRAYIILHMG